MGFLKRMFSIGSKKNKKQRPQIVHNVDAGLRAIEEEEHEAAVGRLLRSSSTRYAVVSEIDYASLPPIPHPINDVIQPPAASTSSLASSTISQRVTYNVTVHKRTRHTPAEFSNANREEDLARRRSFDPAQSSDTSHLLDLRSNPSVASLLDMYDDHGRLPAQAFSNSPPSPGKVERAQTRRNGSTLRQLLGEPPSLNSRNGAGSTEGDISWAERFLGEIDSVSSAVSSVELPTPRTPNTHFDDHSQHNDPHDRSFTTDHDLSTNTYENPAISSMEVELSIADSLPSVEYTTKNNSPYTNPDSTTPKRASQIFGFLTERRWSKYTEDQDRPLPELPSAFSVSSDEGSPGNSNEGRSHFSDDSCDVNAASAAYPAIPIPPSSDTFPASRADTDHQPPDTSPEESHSENSSLPSLQKTSHYNVENIRMSPETVWEAPNPRRKGNTVNAPTRVIVTAPTPSGKHETPSRIPRGPRSQSRRMSTGSNNVRRASTFAERSSNSAVSRPIDPFTPLIPKRRSHRRTPSNGSSSSHSRKMEIGPPIRLQERGSRRRESGTRSILTELNKENEAALSVKPVLPSTPLRSKSDSKSLFRAAVTPQMFRPPRGMTPSPASSSELSPVGKELMMNVRQQRSRAREAERQRSGGRFGFGANRG